MVFACNDEEGIGWEEAAAEEADEDETVGTFTDEDWACWAACG